MLLYSCFIKCCPINNCSLHSFADNSTHYYFTTFTMRPSQQALHNSMLDTTRCLTSDLTSTIRNLVFFNASKKQFSLFNNLTASSRNLSNTQLFPSSAVNIPGLSLTSNLNLKIYISSVAKPASPRLGVLYRVQQLFPSPPRYKGLIYPRIECASYSYLSGDSLILLFFDRVESEAFRFISSFSLNNCLLTLHLFVFRLLFLRLSSIFPMLNLRISFTFLMLLRFVNSASSISSSLPLTIVFLPFFIRSFASFHSLLLLLLGADPPALSAASITAFLTMSFAPPLSSST